MASSQAEKKVITELSALLASSYVLYLKTQKYHWNVTGPMFTTLHTLFETQYTELAAANDEIAERIRALGAFAPGSFAEFSRLSVIKEASGRPKATKMIEDLAAGHESLSAAARRTIEAADKAGDEATADLGTRRVDAHDKHAWMLRSHLE